MAESSSTTQPSTALVSFLGSTSGPTKWCQVTNPNYSMNQFESTADVIVRAAERTPKRNGKSGMHSEGTSNHFLGVRGMIDMIDGQPDFELKYSYIYNLSSKLKDPESQSVQAVIETLPHGSTFVQRLHQEAMLSFGDTITQEDTAFLENPGNDPEEIERRLIPLREVWTTHAATVLQRALEELDTVYEPNHESQYQLKVLPMTSDGFNKSLKRGQTLVHTDFVERDIIPSADEQKIKDMVKEVVGHYNDDYHTDHPIRSKKTTVSHSTGLSALLVNIGHTFTLHPNGNDPRSTTGLVPPNAASAAKIFNPDNTFTLHVPATALGLSFCQNGTRAREGRHLDAAESWLEALSEGKDPFASEEIQKMLSKFSEVVADAKLGTYNMSDPTYKSMCKTKGTQLTKLIRSLMEQSVTDHEGDWPMVRHVSPGVMAKVGVEETIALSEQKPVT